MCSDLQSTDLVIKTKRCEETASTLAERSLTLSVIVAAQS